MAKQERKVAPLYEIPAYFSFTETNNIEEADVDLHCKILDLRPPLGQIFFIFMQFSGQFGQIIGWRPLTIWSWYPSLGKKLDWPCNKT